MKSFILLVCLGLGASLSAKIPIAASVEMSSFVLDNQELSSLLSVYPQKNETLVRDNFMEHEVKLAIVRSDFLHDIFLANREQAIETYRIIGKIHGKAMLYYATKEQNSSSIEKSFSHKRTSVGMLGNGADIYLKKILQQKGYLHQSNIVSYDPYRSIKELKKGNIDSIFLFATQKFSKQFPRYLSPYPEGLKEILEEDSSLICRKSTYCYASYYLIASDSIGKGVMENIYLRVKPFLSKDKALTPQLGKYYIPSRVRPKQQPKTTYVSNTHAEHIPSKTNIKTPIFHRTPWMDLAIAEAIRGRGTAENVLPMLDLSYKYIRFAKGNSGITTAPNDNKEGSWCAAYICWTLGKSGYKIHKSGRMASQSFRYFNNKLYRKIDTPIFGAITVYTNMKNPAHGHVGYLFGKTKSGRYILLGGNQSNRLKFADYASHFGSYALRGFYVPMDYSIKDADRLMAKDIYPSARYLNKKYGILGGRNTKSVR